MSELTAEVARLQKPSGAGALRARLRQLQTSEARVRSVLGSGELPAAAAGEAAALNSIAVLMQAFSAGKVVQSGMQWKSVSSSRRAEQVPVEAHHIKEKTPLDAPGPASAAGPGLPGPLPAAEAALAQSLDQTPAAAPAKPAPAAPDIGLPLSTATPGVLLHSILCITRLCVRMQAGALHSILIICLPSWTGAKLYQGISTSLCADVGNGPQLSVGSVAALPEVRSASALPLAAPKDVSATASQSGSQSSGANEVAALPKSAAAMVANKPVVGAQGNGSSTFGTTFDGPFEAAFEKPSSSVAASQGSKPAASDAGTKQEALPAGTDLGAASIAATQVLLLLLC